MKRIGTAISITGIIFVAIGFFVIAQLDNGSMRGTIAFAQMMTLAKVVGGGLTILGVLLVVCAPPSKSYEDMAREAAEALKQQQ